MRLRLVYFIFVSYKFYNLIDFLRSQNRLKEKRDRDSLFLDSSPFGLVCRGTNILPSWRRTPRIK